jgi:hypothetical protein
VRQDLTLIGLETNIQGTDFLKVVAYRSKVNMPRGHRFRDWAQFVAFWDEFLRDNDRVQLYIDDDNMLISHHMTRNQQGMLMLMAWQAEVHLEEQSKKTKSGISAYRANNPDKGWGRPRDTSTDHMLRVLMENQMLNQGKVNWSELSRELGKSRAKLKADAQELGLLD